MANGEWQTLQFASDTLKNDKSLLYKLAYSGNPMNVWQAYNFVSDNLKKDKDFFINCILTSSENGWRGFKFASDTLKNDLNFVNEIVDHLNAYRLKDRLKDSLKDEDKNKDNTKNFLSRKYLSKEMIIKLINRHPKYFHILSKYLQDDKNIIIAALSKDIYISKVIPLYILRKKKVMKTILNTIIEKFNNIKILREEDRGDEFCSFLVVGLPSEILFDMDFIINLIIIITKEKSQELNVSIDYLINTVKIFHTFSLSRDESYNQRTLYEVVMDYQQYISSKKVTDILPEIHNIISEYSKTSGDPTGTVAISPDTKHTYAKNVNSHNNIPHADYIIIRNSMRWHNKWNLETGRPFLLDLATKKLAKLPANYDEHFIDELIRIELVSLYPSNEAGASMSGLNKYLKYKTKYIKLKNAYKLKNK